MAPVCFGRETTLEEDAVKADELLLWMSARQKGSWQQFRVAVEEFHSADNDAESGGNITPTDEFRLHQRLRLNLECLAHTEFFVGGCEDGWRVVPPMLAAHPAPEGCRAILCGARSPRLRERIIRSENELSCERLESCDAPEVIRFTGADVAALSTLAEHIGVHFQPDAPLAILSLLPPCDPPSRRRPQSEFPEGAGWRIREFDARSLGWQTTDRQHAQTSRTGLFEFQLYDQWLYFLRWSRGTFKVPRAVALYAVLRHHRGLLRYDAQARALSLPGSCRPPRVMERALVLCSGFPPSFDPATSRLTYADVPPDIARFTAELLRQPLA
jgi:hypothetical protein